MAGIKCVYCKKEVAELDFKQATLFQTDEYREWCVNLILLCPHCEQAYNAFIPTMELTPAAEVGA
ncbi:hypothetical protein Y819_001862 [Salmonella enterica subsp. enterica]|nr:hypothetical protein [Salmonella enterica]EDM9768674.1 hypothetical protein [Salmonella enterica subsp. enterica serovar Corvallis]EDP8614833.1 hypothetical protein [Salmonella enterica subsp. enterica]ECO4186693.1 hypothetical protein [Salmonella enterica]EKY7092078.1 hypothetical protein [Salmonella enterica]